MQDPVVERRGGEGADAAGGDQPGDRGNEAEQAQDERGPRVAGCAAAWPRRVRSASGALVAVDLRAAGGLDRGRRGVDRGGVDGVGRSGPTSRFAASTASSTAKLTPLPPTGEMTCAASPISSSPGSLHRSVRVIRTGSSESWLTSVSPSSRSPSQGSRRRSSADAPGRCRRCAAPGRYRPGWCSRAASSRPGRAPRASCPGRRSARGPESGGSPSRRGTSNQQMSRCAPSSVAVIDGQGADLRVAPVRPHDQVGPQPVPLAVAGVLDAGHAPAARRRVAAWTPARPSRRGSRGTARPARP